ncbi:MAG: hypothetical protein CMB53_03355 [Euryarchaeota archaeon]|nr:hypothetical protein [Euryarchaeota archaeon]
MTERSLAMGAALFLAPSLCVVSVRFGLPALDEVISENQMIEVGIHSTALLLGLLMFLRYRRVEDHEYHRSRAIKGLSRTYKREDRGLWGEKSDLALEKLESGFAKKSRKSSRRSKERMSGTVGSLNSEMEEKEVGDDFEADVRVSGIQTIVDEHKIKEETKPRRKSIASRIGSILDSSARRRLEKKKAKEERRKVRKKANKSSQTDSEWDAPVASTMARSVVSCKQCGNLNNSGIQYCVSCGDLLV